MSEDHTLKPPTEDPGFLVARGRFPGSHKDREMKEKDHCNKLANAVYKAVSNHGYAKVRAIGTYAIANAVRAVTLATDRCKKKGISLMWETCIEEGNFGPLRREDHVQNVIAYSFRIKHWEETSENNE